MNTSETPIECRKHFWIFGSLGLGDHIVCNALYRHYSNLHKDKVVIIPIWEHNLAAVQWMLSDVPNIFFYPIETEQQLLVCRNGIDKDDKLCVGFYKAHSNDCMDSVLNACGPFNPVLWDSEFYRQAGLDPELKWKGFKLPEFKKELAELEINPTLTVCHHDPERGFQFKYGYTELCIHVGKLLTLEQSAFYISKASEIHCIDSSMLNLADLMETPYCKRFVFHRYARKGLPPKLRKPWEILD